MATHSIITPEIPPADALPVTPASVFPRFAQAGSMPEFPAITRVMAAHVDSAEQARAMNAILAELNAILATGGAHV